MMKFKMVTPEIKSFNDTDLWIEHFISTEGQDRGGDIMEAKGMQMDGIPVVLWQHGQDPVKGYEPIAKPLEFKIGKNKKGDMGIIAKTQFPNDDEGLKLYGRVKSRFLPNWSIGFEGEGDSIAGGGVRYKNWKLLEYSNVAIPMNADATNLETGQPQMKELNYKILIDKKTEDGKFACYQNQEEFIQENSELNKMLNESENVNQKSIKDDTQIEIAYSAMHTMFYNFVDKLYSVEPKKSNVKTLLTDFTDSIMEYALMFSSGTNSGLETKDFKIDKPKFKEFIKEIKKPDASPADNPVSPEPLDNGNDVKLPVEKVKTGISFTGFDIPKKVDNSQLKENVQIAVKKAIGNAMKEFNKSIGRIE